ncbi:hypothetical protein BH10CYA1_BH10CYA1_37200 [soil metagenome]
MSGEVDFTRDAVEVKNKKDYSSLYRDLQHDHLDPQALKRDVEKANSALKAQGLLGDLELVDNETVASKSSHTSATFLKNGATIEHVDNADAGHVTKITYPDGSTSALYYNDDKTVRLQTNSDKEGKITNKFEVDQTTIKNIEFNEATGDVTKTKADRTSEVQKPDGSILKHGDNGNPDRITEITDLNGTTNVLEYDGEAISSITTTAKGGSPVKRSFGDGETATRDPETGDVVITSAKVGTREVHHTDGTTVVYDDNAKPSRVTEVDYADGKKRQFHYDTTGKIDQVTEPNGYFYKRGDNDTMTEYDSNGGVTGKTFHSTHEVDSDGNYIFHNLDANGDKIFTTTIKRDGSEETHKEEPAATKTGVTIEPNAENPTKISKNGKEVAHKQGDSWVDAQGNPADVKVDQEGTVRITYPQPSNQVREIKKDGSEIIHGRRSIITIDAEGNATHKVKDGDTLWAIAEDNWVRMHPAATTKPTVKEIQAEIVRIANNSNPKIKSPYNMIHSGTVMSLTEDKT